MASAEINVSVISPIDNPTTEDALIVSYLPSINEINYTADIDTCMIFVDEAGLYPPIESNSDELSEIEIPLSEGLGLHNFTIVCTDDNNLLFGQTSYYEFTFEDTCVPSWTCTEFEECWNEEEQCVSAIDDNHCYATTGAISDLYNGDYSELAVSCKASDSGNSGRISSSSSGSSVVVSTTQEDSSTETTILTPVPEVQTLGSDIVEWRFAFYDYQTFMFYLVGLLISFFVVMIYFPKNARLKRNKGIKFLGVMIVLFALINLFVGANRWIAMTVATLVTAIIGWIIFVKNARIKRKNFLKVIGITVAVELLMLVIDLIGWLG